MSRHKIIMSTCALLIWGVVATNAWAQEQRPRTTASATVHEIEDQSYVSSFRSTVFIRDGYLSINFNSTNKPLQGLYKLPPEVRGALRPGEELLPDVSWRDRHGERFAATSGQFNIKRIQGSFVHLLSTAKVLYRIDYDLGFEHTTKDKKLRKLHKKGSFVAHVNHMQCHDLGTLDPNIGPVHILIEPAVSNSCKLFLDEYPYLSRARR